MTGEPALPRPAEPATPPRAARIFVVDDSAAFRGAADAVIRAAGCDPAGRAASAGDAWSTLSAVPPPTPPDLVLVGVQLPDGSGTDLASALTGRLGLRVALVSTLAEADLPATPAACGAIAFVSKSALDPPTVVALATPRAR
ncbi:MAG: response regulator [Vicinamibacterales bacterium]